MTLRLNRRAILAAPLLVLLSGCAKPPPPPPPPPPPTVAAIGLQVAPGANPDTRGRASPVVVRLYELKSLAAFGAADFFSLAERDKETLGPELVAREELLLQPGESRKFDRTLDPATRFVAVVAAYRDMERASWRASVEMAPHKTTKLAIDVQERAISIAVK